MANHANNNRIRCTVGNILVYLPGIVVMMSSVVKLAGVPGVVHQMATLGFTGGRYALVAILELLTIAVFRLAPAFGIFGWSDMRARANGRGA